MDSTIYHSYTISIHPSHASIVKMTKQIITMQATPHISPQELVILMPKILVKFQ